MNWLLDSTKAPFTALLNKTPTYNTYMAKKTPTYEQAMQRLEEIVQGFEQNTLELDQLTAQLAEAQELIKLCNDKLQQVETDVKKLLNDEQE